MNQTIRQNALWASARHSYYRKHKVVGGLHARHGGKSPPTKCRGAIFNLNQRFTNFLYFK